MKYRPYILWGLVLTKLLLHLFLISPEYDLHRDEYLHLDQAHHLAWGYESVPPFTSWISWLILQAGNSVFWVKFYPALFGALTMVVVWKIIEALGGSLFAMVLGSVSVMLSVMLRINILYQPNSFDILAWTMLYYSVLQYVRTDERRWLWIAAVTLALGLLNKYSIVFLVMGMLPALLLTEHRKILQRRSLYQAGALALLLIAPNLAWQYVNHFPVVHHLNELAATQLVNVKREEFIKDQLLFFPGALHLIVAAIISLLFYRPFRRYRLFVWSFVFSLLIFIYFKAKSYYAIGLYPVLLAFGAVYLEKISANRWKLLTRTIFVVIPILLFFPFLRIGFPIYSPAEIEKRTALYARYGVLRWEDGKNHTLPQDFADMLGWRELAQKVDSAYSREANNAQVIVLCDNYGQAGAINYYSRFKNINAVSYNADYINWIPVNGPEILRVIRIKDAHPGKDILQREKTLFKTIRTIGTIENTYAREHGTAIFYLADPNTSINDVLRKDIDENKWDYR